MDMATKEKLLALLEQHTDEYASGQEIAEQLGISRADDCDYNVTTASAGGIPV